MLRLIANKEGGLIELINETLRSFIINSEFCPGAYFIDQPTTHYHVLKTCLNQLSGEAGNQHFARYVAKAWSVHLHHVAPD